MQKHIAVPAYRRSFGLASWGLLQARFNYPSSFERALLLGAFIYAGEGVCMKEGKRYRGLCGKQPSMDGMQAVVFFNVTRVCALVLDLNGLRTPQCCTISSAF
jgi:hypothetical protein